MKTWDELYPKDNPLNKGVNSIQSLKINELVYLITKADRKTCKRVASLEQSTMSLLTLSREGLTEHQALSLLASLELRDRNDIQSPKITSAEDVFHHLKGYSTKHQEYFLVITLDGASRIINTRVVFIGTLNQSLVHPREVFTDAISDRSAGIIIAHNHPSGTLKPSKADIAITQRLDEVSKLVGIELLDHIILVRDGFYSFTDEGLL